MHHQVSIKRIPLKPQSGPSGRLAFTATRHKPTESYWRSGSAQRRAENNPAEVPEGDGRGATPDRPSPSAKLHSHFYESVDNIRNLQRE